MHSIQSNRINYISIENIYFLLSKALIHMPFFSIYLSQKGISEKDIILFFSIYPISILILEIPAGLVSDFFGNLKSLRLGKFITLIATAIFIYFDNIFSLFLCQILWALGDSMISGSDQSFFYRRCKDKKINYEQFSKTSSSFVWMGICISFAASYLFSSLNIEYVFYCFLFISLVSFIITIIINDNCISENKEKNKSIASVFGSIANNMKSKNLSLFIIISSLTISFLSSVYLLIQPLMEEINISGDKNGIYYFIATLFAFIAPKLSFIYNKFNLKSNISFIMFNMLVSVCIFIISFSGSVFYFILSFSLFRFMWGLAYPIINININDMVKDEDSRATVFSFYSMSCNLIQFLIIFLVSIKDADVSNSIFIISVFLFIINILLILLIKTFKLI
ncbi:hypothetical protein AB832_08095 [Flavobacteriaceae bacterium (ex Bugula neritina AB1)]|nr:hypothetical protein AB832_08095 [Flavobacteriaceae bacterium (ex Bugula neritina AB1)]